MSAFSVSVDWMGDGTSKEAAASIAHEVEKAIGEYATTNHYETLPFKLMVMRELFSFLMAHHPGDAKRVEASVAALADQVRRQDEFHRTSYLTDEGVRRQIDHYDPEFGKSLRSES